MADECTHLTSIKVTETGAHVCEECVKTGDNWVHLRMCLTCGHVGVLRFIQEQARDETL